MARRKPKMRRHQLKRWSSTMVKVGQGPSAVALSEYYARIRGKPRSDLDELYLRYPWLANVFPQDKPVESDSTQSSDYYRPDLFNEPWYAPRHHGEDEFN